LEKLITREKYNGGDQIDTFSAAGMTISHCPGIQNRALYIQNNKTGAARREQFEKLTAKPLKPINTLLSFVSERHLGP
jgi:hypothetical protein